jgi:hypothetical protein
VPIAQDKVVAFGPQEAKGTLACVGRIHIVDADEFQTGPDQSRRRMGIVDEQN